MARPLARADLGGLAAALVWALFAVGCAHPGATARPSPQARPDADAVEVALAGAPSGAFLLRCEPSDAEVEVDGVEQGIAADFRGKPSFLRLAPGPHHLELRRAGYDPLGFDVVAGDGRQTLDLRLSPRPGGGG